MLNTSSKRTKRPLKIGITGGIGSGKTTACQIFQTLGIPVFEADREAKQLMERSAVIREALVQLFGAEIYLPDGTLNRTLLASNIFTDKAAIGKVNAIVHPAVREWFKEWYSLQTGPYIVYEAAILFETGYYQLMDTNLLIVAPREVRIARVMERDGVSRKSVTDRMKNQWGDRAKRQLADVILRNDGRHLLTPQIIGLHKKFTSNGTIC